MLALLLVFGAMPAAQAACLPEAIPLDKQRPIVMGGESMPLGIIDFNWASARIATHILKIIASEHLGIQTNITSVHAASIDAVKEVAGCSQTECTSYARSRSHVVQEVWPSAVSAFSELQQAGREVIDFGSIGYDGDIGFYIPREIVDDSIKTTGMHLNYYWAYNESWFDPARFYDKSSSLPSDGIVPCSANNLGGYDFWGNYKRHFPWDTDGINIDDEGRVSPKCSSPNGESEPTWWLSPACRSDVTKCAPFVTTSGWAAYLICQSSAMYNMSIMLADISSHGEVVKLGKANKIGYIWWTPDIAFAKENPYHLDFPRHNAAQTDDGLFITNQKKTILRKVAHPDLRTAAPFLWQTVSQLNIDFKSIMGALANMSPTKAEPDVACLFLQQNTFWKSWIPDKRKCPPGQGMVTSNGSSTEDFDLAERCDRCKPGYHSTPTLIVREELSIDTHYCTTCTQGRAQPGRGQAECEECLPGFYTNTSGRSLCLECSPGQITNKMESTGCTDCSPGHYTSVSGSSTCFECPAGSAAIAGQAQCYLCENGKFVNTTAQSTCTPCEQIISGSTTRNRATSSSAECGCPEGQYKHKGESDSQLCKTCPGGMTCFGFGRPPLLKEGFYADPSNPLFVFECASRKACPGQANSTDDPVCSPHAMGINCGQCMPGFYKTDHTCEKCVVDAGVAVAMGVTGQFLLVGAFHIAWHSMSAAVEISESAFGSVSIGLTISFAQTLGIFTHLTIPWPESLRNLMEWCSMLLFNMDILRSICVVPDSLVGIYLFELLTPMLPILSLAIWFVIGPLIKAVLVCAPKTMSAVTFDKNQVLSTMGMILLWIYVPLLLASMSVFECYANPNGETTVRRFPYVVCGSEEHNSTLPLSITFGFGIFVCGFLAIFSLALWLAPKRFTDPDFRTRVKFLTFKFRPSIWWWSIVLLLRSVAFVSVAPIVPSYPQLQVVTMLLICILSMALQLLAMPYQDRIANYLENCELIVFLLVLSLAICFLYEEESQVNGPLETTICVLVIATFVALFSVIAYLAYRVTCGRNKKRDMHHIEVLAEDIKATAVVLSGLSDESMQSMLKSFSYVDRSHWSEMANLVLLEICGMEPTSVFNRRLPLLATKVTAKTREDAIKSIANDLVTDDRSQIGQGRTSVRIGDDVQAIIKEMRQSLRDETTANSGNTTSGPNSGDENTTSEMPQPVSPNPEEILCDCEIHLEQPAPVKVVLSL